MEEKEIKGTGFALEELTIRGVAHREHRNTKQTKTRQTREKDQNYKLVCKGRKEKKAPLDNREKKTAILFTAAVENCPKRNTQHTPCHRTREQRRNVKLPPSPNPPKIGGDL